jgi:phosphoribosylanthranilate isomerase
VTWIKICGTTNFEDALMCMGAGADALGFVFYEKSPRSIDLASARKIIAELPSGVQKVGVFVNESAELICKYADEAGLNAIQLHGDKEDPQKADLIARSHPTLKIIVAIAMARSTIEHQNWDPKRVYAFLADSGNSANHGGTGNIFDWKAQQSNLRTVGNGSKVIVAGGLTAANVVEAIHILEPWGVDVVSGVEKAPGKKDTGKVRAFIKAVREARK